MILRSLLFYFVFYGGSAMIVVVSVFALLFAPHRLRHAVERWPRLQRWCLRKFLGIDLRVEGAPIAEPALYAFKHESFFEAIDLPLLLDTPATFAKEELFRIPGWGRAAKHYGIVPVARSRGVKALRTMIGAAKEFAADGRPLAIFPEGTRVEHGKVAPLRPGFVGLYKMLGLPVVPVAVYSGPLYHRTWKRSGTIVVRFMEPIPPGLPREEVEQRTRDAINALNGLEENSAG